MADVIPALLPPESPMGTQGIQQDGAVGRPVAAGGGGPVTSPAHASAAWRTMSGRWHILQHVLGGTEAMRQSAVEFLPRHEQENQVAYQRRVAQSVLLNATEMTSESLVGKVFRSPILPKEDVPEGVKALLDNVDLMGTGLNAFCRDLFQEALEKGLSHVLVDMQSPQAEVPPGVPRTLADDRAEALRPYWVKVSPESIIAAYSTVSEGREFLTHVRIRESQLVREGWGEVPVHQVRVLEPDHWWVYRPRDPAKAGEGDDWVVYREGVNSLGYIPLVTFYTARRRALFVCKPPLLDLAYINVAHWQSASDQAHILTVTRFPLLAGSGIGEEEAGKMVIGPDKWLFTQDPQGKWYYVEHRGEAIKAGEADLQRLEDQMAAYGAEVTRKRPGTQTATGEVLGDRAILSPLEAMAMDFAAALTRISGLTATWLNDGQTAPGGSFDVTTDVSTQEVDRMALEAIFRARAARDISRRRYLEMLQVRGVLPDEFDPAEDLDELAAEPEFGMPERGVDPNTQPGESAEDQPATGPLRPGNDGTDAGTQPTKGKGDSNLPSATWTPGRKVNLKALPAGRTSSARSGTKA